MTVELNREGNMIIAMIGRDRQAGIAGYGESAAEALRDLAAALQYEKWPLPELEPPAVERLVRVK